MNANKVANAALAAAGRCLTPTHRKDTDNIKQVLALRRDSSVRSQMAFAGRGRKNGVITHKRGWSSKENINPQQRAVNEAKQDYLSCDPSHAELEFQRDPLGQSTLHARKGLRE